VSLALNNLKRSWGGDKLWTNHDKSNFKIKQTTQDLAHVDIEIEGFSSELAV
jgi:hypothetical protein